LPAYPPQPEDAEKLRVDLQVHFRGVPDLAVRGRIAVVLRFRQVPARASQKVFVAVNGHRKWHAAPRSPWRKRDRLERGLASWKACEWNTERYARFVSGYR